MGFPTVPRPGRRGGWNRLAGGPGDSKGTHLRCHCAQQPLRCAPAALSSVLRLQMEVFQAAQPSGCLELTGKKPPCPKHV